MGGDKPQTRKQLRAQERIACLYHILALSDNTWSMRS
jgi:hypothetical protein